MPRSLFVALFTATMVWSPVAYSQGLGQNGGRAMRLAFAVRY